MAPLDLTGKRFNKLLVLARKENDKRGRSRWLCRCDCGQEKEIDAGHIVKGDTKSCGCWRSKRPKIKNLLGRRFGRLVVLGRSAVKGGQCTWVCQCDCGNQKTLVAGRLSNGTVRSCGCFQKEEASKRGKITFEGAKNPNWKGGITPKHLVIRGSAEYKTWRTAVFARDSYTCQECGAKRNFHAHHIKPFSTFPELRFDISNGQTLCVPCHEKTASYPSSLKTEAA